MRSLYLLHGTYEELRICLDLDYKAPKIETERGDSGSRWVS